MTDIFVYAHWSGLKNPRRIGILRSDTVRGQEIFSFEYDRSWLDSNYLQMLDPDLKLFSGRQYVNDDKENFGLFLDSSPDRWGRMLMDRRETLRARSTRTDISPLRESDYLLGVNDETRMGALRFKLDEDGDFLSTAEIPIPPVTRIRELEQASLNIENHEFFSRPEASAWLDILTAPGSSLGGARPKANVVDEAGELWIAKFPSSDDDRDSGAWEAVVNNMGRELGLNIADGRAERFSGKHHSFLTRRFDRSAGRRIHFASAMTLSGYRDGYSFRDGGSYLELAALIERYGARPHDDIRELWRRIVFSVAVSNTDDHLRNHGFLLKPDGWQLSPAYDINPNEKGHGLTLNISEYDNSLDFDLCMSVIKHFRWEEHESLVFIKNVKETVAQWRSAAERFHIPRSELSMMERAFRPAGI